MRSGGVKSVGAGERVTNGWVEMLLRNANGIHKHHQSTDIQTYLHNQLVDKSYGGYSLLALPTSCLRISWNNKERKLICVKSRNAMWFINKFNKCQKRVAGLYMSRLFYYFMRFVMMGTSGLYGLREVMVPTLRFGWLLDYGSYSDWPQVVNLKTLKRLIMLPCIFVLLCWPLLNRWIVWSRQ